MENNLFICMQIVMLWKLNISYVKKKNNNNSKQTNKQTKKGKNPSVKKTFPHLPFVLKFDKFKVFNNIYFSNYSNYQFLFEEKEKGE